MINRVLIRVKVVQMLYSYMLTRPERTFEQALQDLQASFEKSYDLYLYLIKLIPDLTYIEERRLDDAKHKFQPTEDELNPNTRFIDNQLTRAINDNPAVEKIFRDHMISWNDDPIFMRLLLDKIRNSEVYQDYMALPFTDLMSDTEVWRQLLRKVILDDEDVEEQLQNRSLYISSEDLEVMGQFAIKSLSKMERTIPSSPCSRTKRTVSSVKNCSARPFETWTTTMCSLTAACVQNVGTAHALR